MEKRLNWFPDKVQNSSINFTSLHSQPKNSKLAQMRERYSLQNGQFSPHDGAWENDDRDRTAYPEHNKKADRKVGAHKFKQIKHFFIQRAKNPQN